MQSDQFESHRWQCLDSSRVGGGMIDRGLKFVTKSRVANTNMGGASRVRGFPRLKAPTTRKRCAIEQPVHFLYPNASIGYRKPLIAPNTR